MKGEPKPVYAICGPDAFRKREALHAICRAVQPDDHAFGALRCEGDSADLADVLDGVRTMSLLGGRQLVVVLDADGFITAHRAALENYCSSPCENGTLVLVCSSMPANTKLAKIIAKTGEVLKFEALKGQALATWLVARARDAHQSSIDARAASRLIEFVGPELGSLDGELGKLALFAAERGRIATADVEAVVGQNREQTVFAVTDAIASGDVAAALYHWERVLATDRAAPGRAIGGLAWGFRRLLELKLEADGGAPLASLARRAFVDPATLKQRLDRLAIEDLQEQLSDLLEADLASKTGLSTVATAIEQFVIKHCLKARGSRKRSA
jgi:DNA polymerase-3 subunit delta